MSDIDIERLREAVNLHRSDFIRDEAGNFIWDVTAEGEALWLAAEFLVSLADEGAELWRITDSCAHPEGWPAVSGCDGGSCERVWPPKEDN